MRRNSVGMTIAGATLALGLMASSATAAVTFDPETGLGFVGKGDVQLAFGYNNAAMQAAANGLTFVYGSEKVTERECEDWSWEGEGSEKEKVYVYETIRSSKVIGSTVSYDARSKKQVNGFNLIGIGEETKVVTGDTKCPDGFHPSGRPDKETNDESLSVSHNGQSASLWTPPSPVEVTE